MEVGPVDVYIIGFPGNKFSGRIAPAIQELVDNGTIRVLDLLFVMKDADGVVATLAIEDLDQDGAAFAELDITEPGSLNEEDAGMSAPAAAIVLGSSAPNNHDPSANDNRFGMSRRGATCVRACGRRRFARQMPQQVSRHMCCSLRF